MSLDPVSAPGAFLSPRSASIAIDDQMVFGPEASDQAGRPDEAMSTYASIWCAMRCSLRDHALFIALVLLCVILGSAVPWIASVPVSFRPTLYSENLSMITIGFVVLLGCGYVTYVMVAVRPPRLTDYLRKSVSSVALIRRLAAGLPVFLLLPVIMSTFTYIKFLIPHLNPFAFDQLFEEWDRNLHFGYHPWELLQPILGVPLISAVINSLYHLWLFVMFGVLLWQAFSLSRPRLRMRYLISFVLIWLLLGNFCAILLSSAGPVYFGRVTGIADDPYEPLMSYLYQAGQQVWLPALDVQELLWQSYVDQDLSIGAGISAMPSLHVAMSFSFVLLGFATNRGLGIVFSLFAASIFIGSIHLGWHYALDGYVAVAGTWIIWRAVGWLLDRPVFDRSTGGPWQPYLAQTTGR